MSENQRISNDGSPYKYFHMMYNMCDDELDPFQYRLLGHYIRVCGQAGGHCDEGVRTTSATTKMHIKTVTKARDELAELGYIKQRKPTPAQARKGQTVYITLVDRWEENVKKYANQAVAETPQPVIEGVANMLHLDQKPVTDMPQVGEKAVANMPHKKNIETQEQKEKTEKPAPEQIGEQLNAGLGFAPRKHFNPSPEIQDKARFAEFRKAILVAFGYSETMLTESVSDSIKEAATELSNHLAKPDVSQVKACYDECTRRGWTGITPKTLLKVLPDMLAKTPRQNNILYVAVSDYKHPDAKDYIPGLKQRRATSDDQVAS